MIYEDYYKQMNTLKDEERKVKSKMCALKKKFIEELPFKADDKVEIKNYGVGWIMIIRMSDYGTLNIKYYPSKKNGERSNRCRDAWNVKLEDVKIL